MPTTRPLHKRSVSPLIVLIVVGISGVAHAQGNEPADENRAMETEAVQADATLFPVPEYAGEIAGRAALTGDWGGHRTELARKHGIQVGVDVNQYYQTIASGGLESASEYSGTADYRLKLDTAKAGLWSGGFLELHGESYWGETVNALTGAALAVNTDPVMSLPAGNGTYLSHVVFTQFLSDNFALFIGKLDTTVGDANRFAHGVGDQRFMNLGFSFNPVLTRTSPYSALGAGFLYIPAEGLSFSFTALDSDGSISDSGFDTVFNGDTTYSGEAIIDTSFFSKPGRHTLGFTASTKNYTSLDQDPRIFVPVVTGAPIDEEDGSWAAYYNFDQYLVTDPGDASRGWGLFGRVGISDGDANILHRFFSLGLGGTGIIPGRSRDRFGVGLYTLQLSNNRPGSVTDDKEHGLEVFYNLAATPWFELSADVQWVDGAGRFSDTAVVGGLRGRIVF